MKADPGYHQRNEADARAAVRGWLGRPGTAARRTLLQLIEAMRPLAIAAILPADDLLREQRHIAMFARVISDGGLSRFVMPDGSTERLSVDVPDQDRLLYAARILQPILENTAKALQADGFAIDPAAAVNLSVLAQMLLCEVDLTLPTDAVLDQLIVGGLTGSTTDGRRLLDVSDHVSGRLEDMAQHYRRQVRAHAGGEQISKPRPDADIERRREIVFQLLQAYPDGGPRLSRPTWKNIERSWFQRAGPGRWLRDRLAVDGIPRPTKETYNHDLRVVRERIQGTKTA